MNGLESQGTGFTQIYTFSIIKYMKFRLCPATAGAVYLSPDQNRGADANAVQPIAQLGGLGNAATT